MSARAAASTATVSSVRVSEREKYTVQELRLAASAPLAKEWVCLTAIALPSVSPPVNPITGVWCATL